MNTTTLTLKQPRFSGLTAVALLAAISYQAVNLPFMAGTGISPLVIAIVLGMVIGNLWQLPAAWAPGIHFAAKRLLRLAIILYGFRISFQQIAMLGLPAVILDTLVVSLTLLVGFFVGRKLLKLDRDIALLISAGAAICGAAAVLAVEDVMKSEPYKTAIAIGTVVLFGTLSMFFYPFLQHAGFFHFSSQQFGMFAGASVHEVAQAMVAGANIDAAAGDTAVIVKMMRVLLLVPVLLILPLVFKPAAAPASKKLNLTIPWFALGFIAMIGLNSLHLFSNTQVAQINQIDTLLLTMAMGAIGLETKYSKMKHVGIKPLYLAFLLFIWLMSAAFVGVRVLG